ncbi:hypothetical protein HY412_00220 [Candidatus Kaiserbacteria bacterium]|nr:hypothetical protein [Candidatus Kaiserbacteria bacterium]
MNYSNLTHEHLERGRPREMFTHLQNTHGLQEHGKARVDEAMKAAVAHVAKKYDLREGMKEHHIGEAMNYLEKHYEGRHDLKPKELEVINKSFIGHFGVAKTEEEVV